MHRLKSAFVVFVLVGLFVAAPAHQAAAFNITITINFGHGRECSMRGGICSIVIDLDLRAGSGTPGGNASGTLEGNALAVDMKEAIPEGQLVTRGKKQWLILAADVTAKLGPDAAKKLGKQTLTVQKGEYPVEFAKNELGSFTLKIKGPRESPSLPRPGGK